MNLMTSIIVLPGSVRFWMEVIQGVVLDPAEPWIPSSALDAVRRNDQQELIAPIRCLERSQAPTTRKIWVKEDDGQESAHDLSVVAADLRVGHSVCLLYGAVEGVRKGPLLGTLNLTTGGYCCSDSIDQERLRQTGLIPAHGSRRKTLLSSIVAAAFVGTLCCLFGQYWVALIAGGVTVASTALALNWKRRRWARRMVPYVNQRTLHVLLSRCEFRDQH